MKSRYCFALMCAFGLGLGASVADAQQDAPAPAAAPADPAQAAANPDQGAPKAKQGGARKADARKGARKKAAAKTAEAKEERRPLESLMFGIDELNEIQGRLASGEVTDTNQAAQAIEDASLYLSTIVYYGPQEWTIWVNGVPIGPSQDFQAFQVTEIDPNSVQLLVPLSAQGMRPVRLSPNQTFITKTGMVVEGRVQ